DEVRTPRRRQGRRAPRGGRRRARVARALPRRAHGGRPGRGARPGTRAAAARVADRRQARRPRAVPAPPVVVHEVPVRPAPAVDAAPPVTPNAPGPPELADARRVQANFLETLVFRFLATPLALLLVVLQSRYLHADGRGTFVLVVLTVTVVSRLFGQLGYAVTNRMQQRGVELRSLVRRALALGVV